MCLDAERAAAERPLVQDIATLDDIASVSAQSATTRHGER
jgi:hypothetical protein